MKKLNSDGFEHLFALVAVVVLSTVIGVGLMVASHAATPKTKKSSQPEHSFGGEENKEPFKPTRETYINYAKALMDSGRLSDQDGRYMQQIKDISKGDFSCNVNPTILRMLVGIVVRDNHKVQMSSLNRKCTGVLTASGTSSYHYRDEGGHAIDVVQYDGRTVNGSNSATKDYLKEASKFLPRNTGYGQSDCGSGFDRPKGSYGFSDSCDHQHIQVPVRIIKKIVN